MDDFSDYIFEEIIYLKSVLTQCFIVLDRVLGIKKIQKMTMLMVYYSMRSYAATALSEFFSSAYSGSLQSLPVCYLCY